MRLKLVFAVITAIIMSFGFSNVVRAQAADGYFHDVIRKTHYSYISASKCDTKTYTGALASYKLYIASNGGDLFNFLSDNAKGVGIVTTSSTGRIKSVKLGCSNTLSTEGDQCFFVYGKNTPYDSPDDLIDSEKRGELIATIDKADKSQSFNEKSFTGDQQYKYVGVCAQNKTNSPLLLEYFDFAWEKDDVYTRSEVPAKSLGTICLPYAVNSNGINGVHVFELGGKVMENGDVSRIVFNEVHEMEAGMPYFYYYPSDTPGTLTLTLSETPVQEPLSKNGLHGTFEDLPFSDLDAAKNGNVYIVNGAGELQRASTQSGVHANRAYVVMNEVQEYQDASPSGVRLVVSAEGFSIVDVVTPVETLAADSCAANHFEVYTLQGKKVQSTTSAGDIVVGKGRKFIAK